MPRKHQYYGGIIGASPFATPWDGSGAEFLLVGGGGSGGRGPGAGGGGAGGMVVGTNQTFSLSTPYSIVIGRGGDHGATNTEDNGENSTFSFQSLVATGGGRARQVAYNTAQTGAPGGSGGGGSGGWRQSPLSGGSATQASYSALTGITGYGNAGGTSADWYPNEEYYGAGGGGAGSAGVNGVNSSRLAGDGGDGRQWGVDGQYYAGGGGGTAFDDNTSNATLTTASRGSGGLGGGGAGLWRNQTNTGTLAAVAGSPNTGGGGGGGSTTVYTQNGQGGSGVFKIWVPVRNYTNYVVGAELTEAASQQVTYGGTAGTLITITASSGTSTNTITFN